MKIFIDKSGVTLVEIIMASVLLTMIVGSFLSILLMSSNSVKTTDYIYTATDLAKSRIERLKGLDYNSLPNSEEIDIRLDKSGNPDPNSDFYRTTEVNPNYNGIVDLTEVEVKVDYVLGGKKSPQAIVMKTLFVKPEG